MLDAGKMCGRAGEPALYSEKLSHTDRLEKYPEAVLATLSKHGVELSDLEVVGAGLEEAFLQLTGTGGSGEKTGQGMSHPRA